MYLNILNFDFSHISKKKKKKWDLMIIKDNNLTGVVSKSSLKTIFI